jgi:hypothetical protein
MRRRTGADERQRTDAFKVKSLDGVDAARVAEKAHLDRLHFTWSPAIKYYLDALGKITWGPGKYELVDEVDPDASWREYQVKELEWHERTDRYTVRNQDDWYECAYRLGYRLRLEVKGDQYMLGYTPLTANALKQWFLGVYEEGCPQRVEERLIRIY